MKQLFCVCAGMALALLSCAQHPQQNKKKKTESSMNTPTHTDTATFGTGCFWCTEALFEQLNGVIEVTSGYSGGHIANPTYEQVCTKTTGHAEVVNIVYDSSVISFDELLEVFWQVHDPTTLNRQGADEGPQYRSVIFYHSDEQKEKAIQYKAQLNAAGAYDSPIVTEISPFTNFYPAEEYHQNFYNNNPNYGYCRVVIRPKIDKFEKVFKKKLKTH